MKTQRTALIAGASGLVGSHLLQLLLQNDNYSHVTALLRKPLPIQHPKLKQVITDFEKLDELPAINADDIFCCLGATMKTAGSRYNFHQADYIYVVELARLGKRQGASQFLVISSMGADAHSIFFYNRVKGEMERTISNFSFKAVHIFRPSLLLGERTEKRRGEKIGEVIMKALEFILVGPLRKYRAIPAETVARAMLNAALQDSRGASIHKSDELFLLAKSTI